MSHWATLMKVELGLGFDEKMKEWKNALVDQDRYNAMINAIHDVCEDELMLSVPEDMLNALDDCKSQPARESTDSSSLAITCSAEHTFDALIISEKVKSLLGGKFNDVVFNTAVQKIKEAGTTDVSILCKLTKAPPQYQIIGDNVDLVIKVKHMSSTNQNNSIHWFHLNGVLNRVNGDGLSNEGPIKSILDVEKGDFLPSYQDNLDFLHDLIPLVARRAVMKIPALEVFKDVVVWHIPHNYSKEMSMKSCQVFKTKHYI